MTPGTRSTRPCRLCGSMQRRPSRRTARTSGWPAGRWRWTSSSSRRWPWLVTTPPRLRSSPVSFPQGSARGDLRGAEEAARRAEQLDEHSDVAVRARLRALALAGDRGQALAAFTAFATRLQRDLGAEPDADTRALADRIRQGRRWRVPDGVP